MAKLNMVEAVNSALRTAMARDENVIVLGEDVGVDGGVFRATQGLWQSFGENRVIDTPLSEGGIIGTSIGMAIYGLRPIAEIQFEGFTFPAFDEVLSHVARMRNRSRGRFTCPFVMRTPYGGGVHALEHHSDAPETLYAHIAGIKVVIPSNPYDTKGLLLSAITGDDPVVFFEPKKLYRAFKEEVPDEFYTVPIGEAKIVKEGTDVSMFTYGSMVHECLKTQEELKNVNMEIIDLRTVAPLDLAAIKKSVEKTGRAVIVHEAPRSLGIGAEVAAYIADKSVFSLKSPIKRVTGYDVPTPLPKLEEYFMPNPAKIISAVEEVMRS